MGDDKERTQRLAPDAEGTHAALTQTDAPHTLARNYLHATTQNKSRDPPSCRDLDGHAKSPGHRGSCGRAGRVGAIGACGRHGAAGLARVCKGQGGAHLPVEDADVILGATSVQGVS